MYVVFMHGRLIKVELYGDWFLEITQHQLFKTFFMFFFKFTLLLAILTAFLELFSQIVCVCMFACTHVHFLSFYTHVSRESVVRAACMQEIRKC